MNRSKYYVECVDGYWYLKRTCHVHGMNCGKGIEGECMARHLEEILNTSSKEYHTWQ